MKDARDIIKRPIITEKSYDLMNEGKFTFEVDKKANKKPSRRDRLKELQN